MPDIQVPFNTVTTSKDITVTDTAAHSGTISDIARCGVHTVIHAPSSDSQAIVTGTMHVCVRDSTNGDMIGSGHGIGLFGHLQLIGNGDFAQEFAIESRVDMTGTGTVGQLTLFKPVVGTMSGTVSELIVYGSDVSIAGVTNPYFIKNLVSGLKIQTSGIIEGATGNECPTADIAGIADGRYYFPANWGSSSVGSFTRSLLVAPPPINIPARTVFNRIGIEVTTAVASTTIRLGVYKMLDGVPDELVYDAGTVDSGTTGVKEVTGDFTLEAGSYFLAYQAEGGASDPTVRSLAYTDYDLIRLYGNNSANPAAAAIEDWIYVGNTGALPASFGAVTRLKVGAVPAVFIRKV